MGFGFLIMAMFMLGQSSKGLEATIVSPNPDIGGAYKSCTFGVGGIVGVCPFFRLFFGLETPLDSSVPRFGTFTRNGDK